MTWILETERLTLRVFEDEDLDAFAALEADPEVMRFYTWSPRSRERAARGVAWFQELQEAYGYSLWAVIHKADTNNYLAAGRNDGSVYLYSLKSSLPVAQVGMVPGFKTNIFSPEIPLSLRWLSFDAGGHVLYGITDYGKEVYAWDVPKVSR